MPIRAVALLSGGLDSMLAVRIMQEQGVEIEALNFRTQFVCCRETASEAAGQLGVRISVIGEEDAYLDVIRRPRFGYGRGANPCVDCRIFMFARARAFMEEIGASLVVSGEVLGQRPMSQKRRDLLAIARHSGLEGRLLRPLSARLLPPTIPEEQGTIDRARLYDFSGRSRKGLIRLAREFGFADRDIPSPSTGCMLTQQNFAPRVFDLVRLQPDNQAWDFALLKVGRHVRFDPRTKVVVGRREAENVMLRELAARSDSRAGALLHPDNFMGPSALVAGEASDEAVQFAGGLILRFAHYDASEPARVVVEKGTNRSVCAVVPHATAESAPTL
jgi:tRNA-specific 2-thiouridylase